MLTVTALLSVVCPILQQRQAIFFPYSFQYMCCYHCKQVPSQQSSVIWPGKNKTGKIEYTNNVLSSSDILTAGWQFSSWGALGGLDDKGDKAMVTSVGKAFLNIITVIGFGYASVRMRVHSFLPLEDTEDKNNGCLLQISQAVRFTASGNSGTMLTMTATWLTWVRLH